MGETCDARWDYDDDLECPRCGFPDVEDEDEDEDDLSYTSFAIDKFVRKAICPHCDHWFDVDLYDDEPYDDDDDDNQEDDEEEPEAGD